MGSTEMANAIKRKNEIKLSQGMCHLVKKANTKGMTDTQITEKSFLGASLYKQYKHAKSPLPRKEPLQ